MTVFVLKEKGQESIEHGRKRASVSAAAGWAGQPSSVEPTSDLFQTAQTEGIIYYPRGRERPLTAPERTGILSRGLWQTSRFPAQHLDPSSGRPGRNSKTKLHAQKKKAIKYSVLRTHPPPTLSLFGLAVSLLKSPSNSGSALFSSKRRSKMV